MLRTGERIGDWIVEARLGEGEHGAIFLARHGLNLNLRGALKVARPPDYDKARTNFIAEIEPLLMLRHEALIHVLGWGEDHERSLLWMTTELVRGRSLEERLNEGAFELEEIGFVFGRLAGALALIHSHGAHHGDLRPSDVLLAEGRHIRITGFGTVFREGNQGQLDAESLAYVGPEYFDDPESCSPVSADIYALGLILHEAITGKRVFPVDPGLKPAPQMARIMGMKLRMGPLDPGENVPLPLRRIVLQTTDPDPAARPPDLSGFLTALSMATREREDQDFPAPTPPLAPAAAPAGHSSVKLSSSVLQQQQRPTPFPFAPPGWGPRAHRVPSPMAGLVRPEETIGVPDAGVVREVNVVERDAAPSAPPIAEAPLYDEPEVLSTQDTWEDPEPVVVPAPLAEPRFDDVPEPVPVVAETPEEPAEAELVDEDDEAVLVEPPDDDPAPSQAPAWPDDEPSPVAVEPPDVAPSSLESERQRQRRTFVPPPPVPDPTLVGPGAAALVGLDSIDPPEHGALPTDPCLDAVPFEADPAAAVEPEPLEPPVAMEPTAVPVAPAVEPIAPTEVPSPPAFSAVVPPAPSVVAPMPTPVVPPPAAVPLADAGPTLAPFEDAPEPTAEAKADPTWGEDATEQVHAAAAALVPPADEHPTQVPEEPEEPKPLDDDEDWSWHEDGGDFDAAPAEHADDSYARPIDQLYADDLEPSASDIASDVFGEHGQTATWMKWALAVVVVFCFLAFVWMFMDRDQPTDGAPGPDPQAATEAAPSAPEPPPLEPAPEPEPVLDLGQVVAAEPAPAEPVATPEPEPAGPEPSSRGSRTSSSGGSGRSSSRTSTPTPAPVWQPEPVAEPTPWTSAPAEPAEPAVAAVEPAAAPVEAPVKGVMDHLRDGWSSLDSGNLVGAQGAFMAAISQDSGNGMAHYGLGQVAERARDYKSATYHYGRALGALGSNPTMKGELEAALHRVGAKSGAATAPAPPSAQPAAEAPAAEEGVQVTRKKRDELEESFRQELWDEDPDE
jgi:serine/threonine protein kinase